jgi:hypothetical protein
MDDLVNESLGPQLSLPDQWGTPLQCAGRSEVEHEYDDQLVAAHNLDAPVMEAFAELENGRSRVGVEIERKARQPRPPDGVRFFALDPPRGDARLSEQALDAVVPVTVVFADQHLHDTTHRGGIEVLERLLTR